MCISFFQLHVKYLLITEILKKKVDMPSFFTRGTLGFLHEKREKQEI